MNLDTLLTRSRDLLRSRAQRRARRAVDPDGLSYVVIVTYGRTGSTVLQGALNLVEGACVRGENHGVVNAMERVWRAAERTRREHGGGVATGETSPWFGAHLVDERAVLGSLRRTLLDDVLAPPVDTKIVGYKEVRFTNEHFATFEDLVEHLVFLDALLPGVRFVVNTRDVAATANSGWWASHPDAARVLEVSRDWLQRLPEALSVRLGAGRVVPVRYEEWSGSADALAAMLSALGLHADRGDLEKLVSTGLSHMK